MRPMTNGAKTHLKNLNGATYLGSQIRVMAISLQNYMQIFHILQFENYRPVQHAAMVTLVLL